MTQARRAPCVHSDHIDRIGYNGRMVSLNSEVSTRELRGHLSDVLGRAKYAGERIGVTRHGQLAAVIVGVEDLEALEEFEMAQDLAAYQEAVHNDTGERFTLEEVRAELGL